MVGVRNFVKTGYVVNKGFQTAKPKDISFFGSKPSNVSDFPKDFKSPSSSSGMRIGYTNPKKRKIHAAE